jgi:hypothetical protein
MCVLTDGLVDGAYSFGGCPELWLWAIAPAITVTRLAATAAATLVSMDNFIFCFPFDSIYLFLLVGCALDD